MRHSPSLSIFFPFLNDWGTVGTLITLSIATVEKITNDWEILIINDGSSKSNLAALENIVKTISLSYPKRIKIITHPQNRGYGGALITGFKNASKELIFYTDCDGQYDPRELEKLYKALKPTIGMVNGYKIKRHDPWYRIVAGKLYHHSVKLFFQLPIRDTDCDFRLIRKKVFEEVTLVETTGTICVELVKKIDHSGFLITEVPVHHFYRFSGKSQFFNFARLSKTALALLRLWYRLQIKQLYN